MDLGVSCDNFRRLILRQKGLNLLEGFGENFPDQFHLIHVVKFINVIMFWLQPDIISLDASSSILDIFKIFYKIYF